MIALDKRGAINYHKDMEKRITVLTATSQDTVDTDSFEIECQTIAEAKKRAKYHLTEDYMNMCEMSAPYGYSQVLVNGVCEYDFFGKGA